MLWHVKADAAQGQLTSDVQIPAVLRMSGAHPSKTAKRKRNGARLLGGTRLATCVWIDRSQLASFASLAKDKARLFNIGRSANEERSATEGALCMRRAELPCPAPKGHTPNFAPGGPRLGHRPRVASRAEGCARQW